MIWRIVGWLILSAGFLILGSRLRRGLRSGEFLTGDDGLPTLIRRTESPKSYWALAVFFAALLVLFIGVGIALALENSN
jgi:hypothetical protein